VNITPGQRIIISRVRTMDNQIGNFLRVEHETFCQSGFKSSGLFPLSGNHAIVAPSSILKNIDYSCPSPLLF
jgi:hypothetical protein